MPPVSRKRKLSQSDASMHDASATSAPRNNYRPRPHQNRYYPSTPTGPRNPTSQASNRSTNQTHGPEPSMKRPRLTKSNAQSLRDLYGNPIIQTLLAKLKDQSFADVVDTLRCCAGAASAATAFLMTEKRQWSDKVDILLELSSALRELADSCEEDQFPLNSYPPRDTKFRTIGPSRNASIEALDVVMLKDVRGWGGKPEEDTNEKMTHGPYGTNVSMKHPDAFGKMVSIPTNHQLTLWEVSALRQKFTVLDCVPTTEKYIRHETKFTMFDATKVQAVEHCQKLSVKKAWELTPLGKIECVKKVLPYEELRMRQAMAGAQLSKGGTFAGLYTDIDHLVATIGEACWIYANCPQPHNQLARLCIHDLCTRLLGELGPAQVPFEPLTYGSSLQSPPQMNTGDATAGPSHSGGYPYPSPLAEAGATPPQATEPPTRKRSRTGEPEELARAAMPPPQPATPAQKPTDPGRKKEIEERIAKTMRDNAERKAAEAKARSLNGGY